jgi:hypothetical protein
MNVLVGQLYIDIFQYPLADLTINVIFLKVPNGAIPNGAKNYFSSTALSVLCL